MSRRYRPRKPSRAELTAHARLNETGASFRFRDGDRGPCGKRCWRSPTAARKGTRMAHNRIRLYFCRECKAWHTTNSEKGQDGYGRRSEQ